MICVICGHAGTLTTKALNGLPKGIVACDDCRQAVKDRQVGVVSYDQSCLDLAEHFLNEHDEPNLTREQRAFHADQLAKEIQSHIETYLEFDTRLVQDRESFATLRAAADTAEAGE